MNRVKASTRDMGLYAPSLVLAAFAAHQRSIDTSNTEVTINAADVIIKMSECLNALMCTRDVITHQLGDASRTNVDRHLELKSAQLISVKIENVEVLFDKLHSGESPHVVAKLFTSLTGIKID